MKYDPTKIEKKWQKYWVDNKTFVADDSKPNKKYVLVEFPFPSGDGLHMGHLRSYTAADVLSRYYRLRGHEVMFPMGWDAFGLPAENYAIKHGKQPAETTASNIKNIKKQIQGIGYSVDWSREVNTTDPGYYKWTQWLFLQFYKAGLAYEATGLINWCPKDKTGLANEEVINGHCERCGAEVEKKELRQWYLKITEYAEKLLQGLDHLPEWPDAVKLQQRNWIGKSEGAEIEFSIKDTDFKVKVFTTRPDTIFGSTYLVLAPEHPLLSAILNGAERNEGSGSFADAQDGGVVSNQSEVENYITNALAKAEQERTGDDKEKTGVELKGVMAINPATKEVIPVWVADYVLGNYGTGAIMAVPAHDERDFEFASKFKLEIKSIIKTDSDLPYTGHGELIDSGEFSGQDSSVAASNMAQTYGKPAVSYKMRDWVFSRQRYWGEPIPMLHCDNCGVVPVPDDQLPVLLPEVEKYEPTGTGESPLAAIDEWVNTKCPKCDGPAKRETNTMPQWAGSSWYFLRYTDPKNEKEFAAQDLLKHWMSVDIYFGGMEHTTLHLLYSRFWNIFLYDQGLVPVSEPYTKRVPHGIILAADGSKMSKSKGNVTNPNDYVEKYGADTTRMYELFLGPHGQMVAWNDSGISGVAKFLDRVWRWVIEAELADKDTEHVEQQLHALIKKITEDIESFSYNTAISSFMEFYNEVKNSQLTKESYLVFLKLLYPFAPHISEELHEHLGGTESLQHQAWPEYDHSKIKSDVAVIVVQVNGKVRDQIEVASNAGQQEVEDLAKASEKVQNHLHNQQPKKVIYVEGKLINFVV